MGKFTATRFKEYEAIHFGCVYKALIVECVRQSVYDKEAEEAPPIYFFLDGHWWMQASWTIWQERLPYLNERTLRRYFKELLQSGYLIKKDAEGKKGTKPNFYRLNPDQDLFIKMQIEMDRILQNEKLFTGVDKMSTPPGQNVHPPLVKMTRCPLQPFFDNLKKLKICRLKFIESDYRKWAVNMMEQYSLSVENITELSDHWQEYHNEASIKPISPKASFRTWVKNAVKQPLKYSQDRLKPKYDNGVYKKYENVVIIGKESLNEYANEVVDNIGDNGIDDLREPF